jgi:protein-tyrosine-phosphatase
VQVLFVCVHNSGRSQIAEAFFNSLAKPGLLAISAGTQPAKEINPLVVKAMAEVNIDINQKKPKLVTEEMVFDSDHIITMGCGVKESCPVYLDMNVDEEWGLDDLSGKDLDFVRKIRDEIHERVEKLIKELNEKPVKF